MTNTISLQTIKSRFHELVDTNILLTEIEKNHTLIAAESVNPDQYKAVLFKIKMAIISRNGFEQLNELSAYDEDAFNLLNFPSSSFELNICNELLNAYYQVSMITTKPETVLYDESTIQRKLKEIHQVDNLAPSDFKNTNLELERSFSIYAKFYNPHSTINTPYEIEE